uniref:Uncharacterized protein n=1 Tax=Acinetobacter sp. M131 TaxID=1280052 RepID=V9M5N7_9GAMM|nr:hypothetical protein [Acinetobacter sp. M131]
MGANFPILIPKPSVARKKAYERSEFRVAFAFLKVTKILTKNCPDESSESEIQ